MTDTHEKQHNPPKVCYELEIPILNGFCVKPHRNRPYRFGTMRVHSSAHANNLSPQTHINYHLRFNVSKNANK